MKRCPDCDEWKALDQFPRNRRSKDGRHVYCKLCNNARSRELRQRLHGGSRHYHLKRRYGISAVAVQELIRQQGGICPICRTPDPDHVDHDHATNEVRGVLCFNCNGGLGQFKDDVASLFRAVEYLETTTVPRNADRGLDDVARARAAALHDSAA